MKKTIIDVKPTRFCELRKDTYQNGHIALSISLSARGLIRLLSSEDFTRISFFCKEEFEEIVLTIQRLLR